MEFADRHLDAITAAVTAPDFLATLAVLTLVVVLVCWFTPKHVPDWMDVAAAKCLAETGHRIDRKPKGPLTSTEIFPRLPGLYSEQACRCGRKTKVRRIGSENSRAAQQFRQHGK